MQTRPFITFPLFEQFPELTCIFSIREGGVSKKPFDSLNLGLSTPDARHIVLRNREIFFSSINIAPDSVAYAGQIHSANPAIVTGAGLYKNTDSLIFKGSGTFVSIQTADCFPVFVYAPVSQTVAIIHAGWRGVVSGIINRTFEALKARYGVDPSVCFAAVGPGLQLECFEVREDVYSRIEPIFLKLHDVATQRYLNLNAMIRTELKKAGLPERNIYISKECTFCSDRLFYSYRRDGNKSGRMMGIIGINE